MLQSIMNYIFAVKMKMTDHIQNKLGSHMSLH